MNNIPIYAETCPQYLLLNNDQYSKNSFEEISKYILSPPLRKKEDNQSLWEGLSNNIIQTIATDHCPFLMKDKLLGKDDFRKIPNGIAGVEHRMELIFSNGVLKNKISLTVDLMNDLTQRS